MGVSPFVAAKVVDFLNPARGRSLSEIEPQNENVREEDKRYDNHCSFKEDSQDWKTVGGDRKEGWDHE